MDSGLQPVPSVRSRMICRQFLNGSCRFGPRCHFLHEGPRVPSVQICRYFQKGGCWYGERCRYLHIPLPDGDAAVAGRRGSVPNVSSSSYAGYARPDRRGSEPAVLHTQMLSNQTRITSESLLLTIGNPQPNVGRLTADISEEGTQDAASSPIASCDSANGSDSAEGDAAIGGYWQESSPEEQRTGAGAAAASPDELNVEAAEAFAQSKDITCGICMDKVYEKTDRSEQVFGLLPNCNHSFCLKCIITWRKTKDLQPDVIKSCPQCRVKSPFYVANKYWVEGEAKDSVIAAFKEKCSKRRCGYFMRYRCCPFDSECLYRHDKVVHRHASAVTSAYPLVSYRR
ncbi:makorin, ring finger protein, 4 isoform X2 [Genypterus blacodes]|uniref:makorin, ring finger protein, 4 isoform X2 n=1 Tax=Genypterus blacodes TaxID=154954 RepID=UPI003F75877A